MTNERLINELHQKGWEIEIRDGGNSKTVSLRNEIFNLEKELAKVYPKTCSNDEIRRNTVIELLGFAGGKIVEDELIL